MLWSRLSELKPSPDPMLPFKPSEEFLRGDTESYLSGASAWKGTDTAVLINSAQAQRHEEDG